MSKYVVDGEEVDTKKEATAAVFEAVADGKEVVVAPAPEESEAEDVPQAPTGQVIGGGPPVIL